MTDERRLHPLDCWFDWGHGLVKSYPPPNINPHKVEQIDNMSFFDNVKWLREKQDGEGKDLNETKF